ncbi:uncharacterized protein si:ch211-151h10.2 isoform X2 [Poeciliopsis prolifica]|uniref:uncharacterized protein si:ch211-151h10.2 isoform X2 n=1 Tax=Poeciliopsis prolifica TaxID=188132 RepID=UPI0024136140|nr:uncharacterized protein si:ch211-151h10.2 isoform X2 [Poeciliopsis prolifica]
MAWLQIQPPSHPKGQRTAGLEGTRGWEWTSKPMREDGEGATADNQGQWMTLNSLVEILSEAQPGRRFWSQTLKTFCCFAPVAAVWFACQLEALPGAALPQEDACCRMLLLCLLWAVLAAGIYALKGCLQPEPNREPLQRKEQLVEPEISKNLNSRPVSGPMVRPPEVLGPLTRALTNSLLLCVLQEPLQDPAVSHIEALCSRLQAVAVTLETVTFAPEAMLEEAGRGSALVDKLKLLCAYLQQRTASLQVLVQVQRDFESNVEDLLQGLDGVWTQLEDLHAGVTLTKNDSQGSRDLTLVQEDAESLVSVLAQYRTKLQSCQALLKGCTQLLQELTWSHAHISTKVNSCCESVWPELLLQSNIEQFDKVQENFSSLEQQTATFKTHLEGLGIDHQDEPVGSPGAANRTDANPFLPNPICIVDLPLRTSTPIETKKYSHLSLRERSALKFSTMGCLPKPGRKK